MSSTHGLQKIRKMSDHEVTVGKSRANKSGTHSRAVGRPSLSVSGKSGVLIAEGAGRMIIG